VHRGFPFTIRLKERVGGDVQPVRLKIDPGADLTGVAIVRRRGANLRYRARRFDNRRRPEGWLPPSPRSRVDNTLSWVNRYCSLAPITALSLEHVRFDMQATENPGISGVEYQQCELRGYEVREYLLEKREGRCAYR
jgi:hypothetical protein